MDCNFRSLFVMLSRIGRPRVPKAKMTITYSPTTTPLRRRKDDSDCKHIVADLEITELTQILDCIESA